MGPLQGLKIIEMVGLGPGPFCGMLPTGGLYATGPHGGKPVIPVPPAGDFGGGAMLLAFGMVCALLEARSSGEGQVVDAAITDGSALLMTLLHSLDAAGMWRQDRGSNLLDGGAQYLH